MAKRMWLSMTLLALFLPSAHTGSESFFYKKVSDEVILTPGPVTVPIRSIVWKHGPNLAMEWDGTNIDSYRQFKDRGFLNISSGELTITGLTREDSGSYTAEINNKVTSVTRFQVISPVSKPTVSTSCDANLTHCLLTCDVDTTHAKPDTYSWLLNGVISEDATTQEYVVTKENSADTTKFSCEVANPVSRERSEPIANPLFPKSMKVVTGLMVFASLIISVLILIFIHRWKAGVWFYQKDSIPCTADFWRKEKVSGGEAAESKGATAQPEAPISKPTVSTSCDTNLTHCLLTCDVDTTHAKPDTYSWLLNGVISEDATTQEYVVTKENSADTTKFSCEVANPVSRERSEPIANPLFPKSMKVVTGLTVFASLIISVLILIFIHRWKAGVWFYQKDSIPCTADFWRKEKVSGGEAAESKGATAQPEEEEPMALTPSRNV